MLTKWIHEKALISSAGPLMLAGAIGLGVLIGVLAHGTGGANWVFALLMLSAGAVGVAQQTLP